MMSTLTFYSFHLLLFCSRDLLIGAIVQMMCVSINLRAENVRNQYDYKVTINRMIRTCLPIMFGIQWFFYTNHYCTRKCD